MMYNKAIGGYFEFDINLLSSDNIYYPEAQRYQSARAAFYSLIRFINPDRLWLPNYICEAMIEPLKELGVTISYYSINENFEIGQNISLGSNDFMLYANYFGVCEKQIAKLTETYNPKQIILDCSQAFFYREEKSLATIYSPRKFFGVPDGGLLVTDLDVQEPNLIDTDSVARIKHMLIRLDDSAESGYVDFLKSEESLKGNIPKRMSKLSSVIFDRVDKKRSSEIRTRNFNYLNTKLFKYNELSFNKNINGPLCYPFLCENKGIKEKLIKNKVYVPTYWPDIMERVDSNSFEASLVSHLVPIPCDHRYSINDMEKIVSIIFDSLT